LGLGSGIVGRVIGLPVFMSVYVLALSATSTQ
jgi:hypothetical protein